MIHRQAKQRPPSPTFPAATAQRQIVRPHVRSGCESHRPEYRWPRTAVARPASAASGKSEASWVPSYSTTRPSRSMRIDCVEPLIGMSLKNVAKDFGFGRLRIGAQRRVEPLGEQRRAHVDLARAGAQRQIALEPQMLKGEREDGENRNGDADDNRRRNPPTADRGPGGTRMRAPSSAAHEKAGGRFFTQSARNQRNIGPATIRSNPERFRRLARPASPRLGEAKRRFPAQRSSWPHWTSVPVCRAYTRHRPFPDFATNYTWTAALPPESLR